MTETLSAPPASVSAEAFYASPSLGLSPSPTTELPTIFSPSEVMTPIDFNGGSFGHFALPAINMLGNSPPIETHTPSTQEFIPETSQSNQPETSDLFAPDGSYEPFDPTEAVDVVARLLSDAYDELPIEQEKLPDMTVQPEQTYQADTLPLPKQETAIEELPLQSREELYIETLEEETVLQQYEDELQLAREVVGLLEEIEHIDPVGVVNNILEEKHNALPQQETISVDVAAGSLTESEQMGRVEAPPKAEVLQNKALQEEVLIDEIISPAPKHQEMVEEKEFEIKPIVDERAQNNRTKAFGEAITQAYENEEKVAPRIIVDHYAYSEDQKSEPLIGTKQSDRSNTEVVLDFYKPNKKKSELEARNSAKRLISEKPAVMLREYGDSVTEEDVERVFNPNNPKMVLLLAVAARTTLNLRHLS